MAGNFSPTGTPATHGVPKRARRSSAAASPHEETTRFTCALPACPMSSSVLSMAMQETTRNPAASSHSRTEPTAPRTEKSSGVAPRMFAEGSAVRGTGAAQKRFTTASSASDAPTR